MPRAAPPATADDGSSTAAAPEPSMTSVSTTTVTDPSSVNTESAGVEDAESSQGGKPTQLESGNNLTAEEEALLSRHASRASKPRRHAYPARTPGSNRIGITWRCDRRYPSARDASPTPRIPTRARPPRCPASAAWRPQQLRLQRSLLHPRRSRHPHRPLRTVLTWPRSTKVTSPYAPAHLTRRPGRATATCGRLGYTCSTRVQARLPLPSTLTGAPPGDQPS